MDFLSFFDKCVVLRNTFQGEFVHQIGHEWLDHMFILFVSFSELLTGRAYREGLDGPRESC
jgi:hypothetical protein